MSIPTRVVALDAPQQPPLSAPLDLHFDYTRSLGPVLGPFLGALGRKRIVGVIGSDSRVHVPPVEYDPVTAAPLTDLVEVADTGTVTTWSWVPDPLPDHPLDRPFAFALIRLDGADTAMLHAVAAESPEQMATGMRVRVRWAAEPVGAITDIACFDPVPVEAAAQDRPRLSDAELTAVLTEAAQTISVAPISLSIDHSASAEESEYLRALKDGRVIGGRCPATGKVYVPPRGASPTHGLPTDEIVEIGATGTVTTYCIVNVPFLGQQIKPPYAAAYILLDGADIPILHLVLGVDADQLRMGMRVRAVWKPREEWTYSNQNIEHFEPVDEPDAPFDSYEMHL